MDDTVCKHLFENSEHAVIYWDKNLKLIKANKAAALLYGFSSPEKMNGISYDSLIFEPEIDILNRINESIKNNEVVKIFEKKIKINNEIIWVESHISPIIYKDTYIIQEIDYNITERKKIENALNYEKKKFEKYFNLSPTINVVLDKNGCIRDINEKALEILHVSREEAIGLNWFENFIPKEIKNNVEKVFFDILMGKIKYIDNYENEIINKKGEKRLISWRNNYIKENDKINQVISFGVDITDERRYLERIEYENIFINEFFNLSTELLNFDNSYNIYKKIIDSLVEIVPHAQAGSFVLLEKDRYIYKAMKGYDINLFKNVRLDGKINKLRKLEPFIVKNWKDEYNYTSEDKKIFEKFGKINMINETLYIPLVVNNNLYGAITLDTYDHFFENYEINFAKIIKTNLEFLLWKLNADDKLRQAAEYDYLTKIYNRQSFMYKIKDIIKISKRNYQKIAFIFLDINKFKSINDSYGHNIGDEVLKFFTKKISSILRESDIFARLGGDEFIIALANSDLQGAQKVIDKINKLFEDKFEYENISLKISSSFGIAIFPEDGKDIDILLEVADKRMYEYKNNIRR
ncbi:sensor domain-containing diguanylate cyclase [Marinitoga sp. 38H-ov]|uniref:sensor domain-containing diguanylate cyclase n=1 Tax=Marinitoga sp. 38H-ov TaxID=1755814 RepID=UPI0013EBD160|nr:sensor domain-containing diguanylate cyclase [Marinitoga sp. 38H-ov]KAF2956210.1 hypothetical protein AS160_06955 [Marinitoga sp. 38H-ov]